MRNRLQSNFGWLLFLWDCFFNTYTNACAHRGVRNVNISEDFAYVLNEWSQYKTLSKTFVFYISQMLYIYKRKSSFVNKFYQQKKFAEWHVQFHAQKTRTEIIPKHLVYPHPFWKNLHTKVEQKQFCPIFNPFPTYRSLEIEKCQ